MTNELLLFIFHTKSIILMSYYYLYFTPNRSSLTYPLFVETYGNAKNRTIAFLLFCMFIYFLDMRAILVLSVILQLIYASATYSCDPTGYFDYLSAYPSKYGSVTSEFPM